MSQPDQIGNTQPGAGIVAANQAAVQQVLDLSRALGLTWSLRMATISTVDPLAGTLDGDVAVLSLTNISGFGCYIGERVYVAIVPPSGNFIIGRPSSPKTPMAYSFGSSTAGSTNSTSYGTYPNSATTAITTQYDRSYLKVAVGGTVFSNATTNVAWLGISIAGVSFDVCKLAMGLTNTHLQVYGTAILGPFDAGRKAVNMQWKVLGGGTISTDVNDWFSYVVEEVVI